MKGVAIVLCALGFAPQVQVDKSLFKSLFGSSQIVLVNGGGTGFVIPCVDGIDIVVEKTVNGKKLAFIARLQPGEQAPISIRAPHPRTIHVVFKHYNAEGRFVGATEPRRIDIPPLPQTIHEVVTFAPSQIKPSGGRR